MWLAFFLGSLQLFCLFYSDASNTVFFFLIAASARPRITDEQERFIQRVLEIPLD